MVKHKLILALCLAIYIALAMVYAVVIPPVPDVIENILPAYNLVQHGFLGMGDEEPTMTYLRGDDKYMFWLPPLGYLSIAGWCKVFGCTLFQVRLQTMAWGVVLLLGLFAIGKRWNHLALLPRFLQPTSPSFPTFAWTGIWAVLFCALNYTLLGIPDGRVDMMCAALGVWSLVLGSEWLAAASFMVHPFGGLYALILAIQHKRIKLLPYVIAILLWGVYIIQAPGIWWQQFGGNFVWHFESGGPILLSSGVWAGFGEGWRNVLLVVYLGCAYLTARRNPSIALWFIPMAIGAFMLTTSISYFPHVLPVLALCVAIQMRRWPWLGLFVIAQLVFVVTTLIPYWGAT